MKKIIPILLATALIAGCQTPQETPDKIAVDSVYKTDSLIAKNSKTAAEVVATMESVNLSGCPEDFVKQYKACIKPWKDFAALEKQMYTVNTAKAKDDIASFISDYRSNLSKAVVKLKGQWPQFAEQISKITSDISVAETSLKNVGTASGAVYPKGIFD